VTDRVAERAQRRRRALLERWCQAIQRPVQSVVDDLVAALLPAACLHCRRNLETEDHAPPGVPPSRLCNGGLRRPLAGPFTVPLRLLCPGCARGLRPPAPAGAGEAVPVWSAFAPTPELFALVHAFKYGGAVELAAWFGPRLARAAPAARAPDALLVPVPLHAQRRRERGFDQSALLAREVGQRLGMPVHEHLLVRRRATPPLAALAHAERAAAVQGAFARVAPVPAGAGLVVLVDDVVTTGATTTAAFAALGVPAARTAVLCVCSARVAWSQGSRPGIGAEFVLEEARREGNG